MTKVIRPYEVLVIVRPEASEEIQKQIFKKNVEIVGTHSGKLHSLETWGKRVLGNSIRKHRKGIYFHMVFEADNAAVAELERVMKINENVLRVVSTRLEDGTNPATYLETFKKGIAEGVAKEKDREVKMQQKRAARAHGGSPQ